MKSDPLSYPSIKRSHVLIGHHVLLCKEREMQVKWKGSLSNTRELPGGGAMGATLGNIEFSSQTNHSADCVPEDDRFKWVDDLTVLEKINLINIGLCSYNFKQHVASNIPIHGQYIHNKDLQTQ